MKITLKWLKEKSACSAGVEYFKTKKISDGATLIQKLIDDRKLDWANWGIARMLNRDNRIRYAIYAAELVIEIFEKKYPDDDRPRRAIGAAKKYLKTHSKKDRDAAANAAAIAVDAARAAYADNAAYAAANAAACAAYADNAAYAVSYAANNNDAVKQQIIEYGIKLLKKQ